MKCRAMTNIMQFCFVLMVMVSVFFYAPIEAHAAVNLTGSGSYASSTGRYFTVFKINMGTFKPGTGISNIDSDAFYEVKITTTVNVNSTQTINFSNVSCTFGNFYCAYIGTVEASKTASVVDDRTFYLKGSQLLSSYDTNLRGTIFVKNGGLDTDISATVKFTVDSCKKVSVDAETEYNKGYSAGYSAGEDVGYDSGYSNGYNAGYSAGQDGNAYEEGFEDGKNSVDTDSYYDAGYESGYDSGYYDGFKSGQDSVDTDSYYQAGYNAGYNIAYSLGYEEGYDYAYDLAFDAGYNKAMDEIEQWGADTSQYPKYISGSTDSNGYKEWIYVDWSEARDVNLFVPWYDWFTVNPNHTYKIVVNLDGTSWGRNYNLSPPSFATLYVYFEIGGVRYALPLDGETCEIFVPGDRMSTTYGLGAIFEGLSTITDSTSEIYFGYDSCDISVYDMGPAGDTQNHIANQTDQLTSGYDSSQGAAVNDDFKASVNEYHTAEDSLFSTATSSLENFTFLDFTSITGMVTSLSFVTSIMTSIYMAMGGDTGASGIILAVLFSVMLVSMAIGLYRYYVSNGKSVGSGKGGD